MLNPIPIPLGKLFGNEIEIFEKWHPELERFFEANYVLINNSPITKLVMPMRFDASKYLSGFNKTLSDVSHIFY